MAQQLISVHADPEQLAKAAATEIADELRRAIAERGIAHCVLAGGETPMATYRCLARAPLVRTVNWNHVHFWWTDERWVPVDHPLSNQGAARGALLGPLEASASQVHAVDVSAPSADAAAEDYERLLHRWFGSRVLFDLVLLGVGEDGHVASLFPGSPAMGQDRRWVVVENAAPKTPTVRVSMSLDLLVATRSLAVLVQGARKAPILRRLRDGDRPIGRVLRRAPQARVHVDEAAWSDPSVDPVADGSPVRHRACNRRGS